MRHDAPVALCSGRAGGPRAAVTRRSVQQQPAARLGVVCDALVGAPVDPGPVDPALLAAAASAAGAVRGTTDLVASEPDATAGATPIVVGDGTLTCDDVDRLANGRQFVRLADRGLPRLAANHAAATELAIRSPVYGRSTAVGALLTESVTDSESSSDATKQLLHSHAGTADEPLPNAAIRAMTAVRLEQIAADATGLGPATALALVQALEDDRIPAVGRYCSVGTGDIAALARLGLTLPAGSLGPGDALALTGPPAEALHPAVSMPSTSPPRSTAPPARWPGDDRVAEPAGDPAGTSAAASRHGPAGRQFLAADRRRRPA